METQKFLGQGSPVISVDTKKKELVGNFSKSGQEWQPQGEPEKTLLHDFPDQELGKVVPYGIYLMTHNIAQVIHAQALSRASVGWALIWIENETILGSEN